MLISLAKTSPDMVKSTENSFGLSVDLERLVYAVTKGTSNSSTLILDGVLGVKDIPRLSEPMISSRLPRRGDPGGETKAAGGQLNAVAFMISAGAFVDSELHQRLSWSKRLAPLTMAASPSYTLSTYDSTLGRVTTRTLIGSTNWVSFSERSWSSRS